MKYCKCDVDSKFFGSHATTLIGPHIDNKNSQKTVEKKHRSAGCFARSTTPRQMRVTSQTTARKCSPDSVECAKIGLVARNLMYLVI